MALWPPWPIEVSEEATPRLEQTPRVPPPSPFARVVDEPPVFPSATREGACYLCARRAIVGDLSGVPCCVKCFLVHVLQT